MAVKVLLGREKRLQVASPTASSAPLVAEACRHSKRLQPEHFANFMTCDSDAHALAYFCILSQASQYLLPYLGEGNSSGSTLSVLSAALDSRVLLSLENAKLVISQSLVCASCSTCVGKSIPQQIATSCHQTHTLNALVSSRALWV